MSHNIGRIVHIPPIGIGPNHGNSSRNFLHQQEPGQPTRFVILNFRNANFPANNRLEIDLGYGKDVFTNSNGSNFWTRPINVKAFPDGRIPINYITDGSASGGVELIRFGRAHRIREGDRPCTFTNCDLFLHDTPYTKPIYDTLWIAGANTTTCESDPKWRNFNSLPNGLRKTVGQAVCMIISGHDDHLSTCSGTLIAKDLVFSAGHCFRDLLGRDTASVAFHYETNPDGTRPGSYEPKIFKVVEFVENYYDGNKDYALLRIDISNGDTGITPIPMRTDLPNVGEEVFAIHHPNGAIKKFSPRDSDFLFVSSVDSNRIQVSLDVAGGSSGSGLFDKFGNVVGTLCHGVGLLDYYPTASILNDIGTIPPPPTIDRDVMVVIDRSGSMSQTTALGSSKIDEARDAASLFISMIQESEGHRIGLVSFSNSVTLEHELLPNSSGNVELLIGPSPHSGGKVGAISTGGTTSIGGGIERALTQFSGSASKDEVILLLTDGMENSPPMINDIESSLGNRRLCIVGYGDESNLNGPLLSRLAIFNDGSYTVAQNELALKKFFAACFGDIFESGFLMDPEFELPKNVKKAEPLPFVVCGEDTITIVLGWDKHESSLSFEVISPLGVKIPFNDSNVQFGRGRTWLFLRINLPINGEQDGNWNINVFRPSRGEFPPPEIDLKYFINVIAKGGPSLKLMNDRRRYFTGDTYNPLVNLYAPNGNAPSHAHVELTVKRPIQSLGNILKESELAEISQVAGDTVSSVYSTLGKLKSQNNGRIVQYENVPLELFDDGAHGDGAMEADGIFGYPLNDFFNAEGLYTFHAKAKYGHDCIATRELVWSIFVDTNVDEKETEVKSVLNGEDDSGNQNWTITITPKDKYGNYLGPGRIESLGLSGAYGTEISPSGVKDNGNGSYTVDVTLNPNLADEPGIVVNQPDNKPAVFCKPKETITTKPKIPYWWWLIVLILIIIIVMLLVFIFIN